MSKQIQIAANSNHSRSVEDIRNSIGLWRYWLYKACINFKLTLRGTRLGAVWPNLSLLLVVAVLGTVWGVVLKNKLGWEYYVYLLCGYPVWQFLSSSVNRAARGLDWGGQGTGLPISVLVFEKFSGSVINLIVVMPSILLGILLLGGTGVSHLVWLPVALISVFCWAVGVILLVSVVVTLRPDMRHFINAIMRFSFLATPIIWEPSRLDGYQSFLWFNPFFAPLEFLRASLSGIGYASEVYWLAPLYSSLMLALGVLVFVRFFDSIKHQVSR